MSVDERTAPARPWTPQRGGARRFLSRLLLLLDVVAATLATVLAGLAREALNPYLTESVPFDPVLAAVLVPALVAGLAAAGCYRPAAASLGSDTFRRYARGVALDVLVIGFVAFALRAQPSRLYLLLVAVLLLAFGTLFRWRARRFLARAGLGLSTVALVVGTDDASWRLADSIHTDEPGGYRVVGLVATEAGRGHGATGAPRDDLPVVGGVDDLARLVEQVGPDAVVASTSSLTADELRAVYLALEPTDVELVVHPSLVEVAARRLDVETAGALPLLHLAKARLTPGKRAAKRLLDLTLAGSLTVLTAPLIAVLVVLVRLDSPGPAFFRQTRVGHRGEHFRIWKLRTMHTGAESLRDELEDLNEVGPGMFKLRDDPRVTRVGGFLRRYSLDELPQLWNVVVGEMSMVGPRPLLLEDVANQTDEGARRVRLMPGMTGWWQVSGRSDLDADEALRLDLFYVENWSLAFDLLILARTLRVVLTGEGAY